MVPPGAFVQRRTDTNPALARVLDRVGVKALCVQRDQDGGWIEFTGILFERFWEPVVVSGLVAQLYPAPKSPSSSDWLPTVVAWET